MPDNPTVVLTRPLAASKRFAKMLPGDAQLVISPLLKIENLPHKVDLEEFSWIILTSENGLRALAAGHDLAGRAGFAVGNRTAKAARALGMKITEGPGTAEQLVSLIKSQRPSGKLLHVRGRKTRGNVAGSLTNVGILAEEIIIYEQVPIVLNHSAKTILRSSNPVLMPVFSPETARLLSVELSALGAIAPVTIIALSPAVAGQINTDIVLQVLIADQPNAEAMLNLVTRQLGRLA